MRIMPSNDLIHSLILGPHSLSMSSKDYLEKQQLVRDEGRGASPDLEALTWRCTKQELQLACTHGSADYHRTHRWRSTPRMAAFADTDHKPLIVAPVNTRNGQDSLLTDTICSFLNTHTTFDGGETLSDPIDTDFLRTFSTSSPFSPSSICASPAASDPGTRTPISRPTSPCLWTELSHSAETDLTSLSISGSAGPCSFSDQKIHLDEAEAGFHGQSLAVASVHKRLPSMAQSFNLEDYITEERLHNIVSEQFAKESPSSTPSNCDCDRHYMPMLHSQPSSETLTQIPRSSPDPQPKTLSPTQLHALPEREDSFTSGKEHALLARLSLIPLVQPQCDVAVPHYPAYSSPGLPSLELSADASGCSPNEHLPTTPSPMMECSLGFVRITNTHLCPGNESPGQFPLEDLQCINCPSYQGYASATISEDDYGSGCHELPVGDTSPVSDPLAHFRNPYSGLITKRSRGRRVPSHPEEMTNLGKSGKVYTCRVPACGKLFKRSEHLKRHVRSIHSEDKPFPCQVCNKCFSRQDNLHQHMRVHGFFSTNLTSGLQSEKELSLGLRGKIALTHTPRTVFAP